MRSLGIVGHLLKIARRGTGGLPRPRTYPQNAGRLVAITTVFIATLKGGLFHVATTWRGPLR